MRAVVLLDIEWNCYNGFILSIFHLDAGSIDSALLEINVSREFLYIDLFFITIKVFDKELNLKIK
jgi:hypothetical protein